MLSTSKRTPRDYSLAFKLAGVDQIEKGELNHKPAQQRDGIQGRSTVLVWLRKHGKLDWSKNSQPMTTPGSHTMSDESLPLTPEQRIKELEQQLAESKMKAEFFEAVVDVLERDYGVSIVKKPRARSSKRKR